MDRIDNLLLPPLILLDHLLKRSRVVAMGKRLVVWNSDIQKLAKWRPAILYLIDEQPFERHVLLHLGDVLLIDRQGKVPIRKLPGEGALPDHAFKQGHDFFPP